MLLLFKKKVAQLFDTNAGSTTSYMSNVDGLNVTKHHRPGSTMKNTSWTLTPNTYDPTKLSNINKLFSEKIDVFSPVDANQHAILAGLLKISLKVCQ